MGNCSQVSQCVVSLKQAVQRSIQEEACEDLKKALKKLSRVLLIGVDEEIAMVKSLSLNALGYALATGKLRAFKYLKDKLHASPVAMESKLSLQQTSGINLLCQNGNLEFIRYYLPIYLESELKEASTVSMGGFYHAYLAYSIIQKTTPVQIAVNAGRIDIL